MYKIALMILTFLPLMFSVALAQENHSVEGAVSQLYKAMISADEATLQQLISDKVSYGHSSGKVEGKTSFINSLISGASDFVSIDVRAQSVEVLDNTAIVRHEIHAQTQDGGKPGTVSLYILLIWQKQGANWQLIARQAVRMPQ